jgi:hypothetical protein
MNYCNLVTQYANANCTNTSGICALPDLLNARERYFKALMNPFLNPLIKENINYALSILEAEVQTDMTWQDASLCGMNLYDLNYQSASLFNVLDGKFLNKKYANYIPPYVKRIFSPELFVVIVFIILIYISYCFVMDKPINVRY